MTAETSQVLRAMVAEFKLENHSLRDQLSTRTGELGSMAVQLTSERARRIKAEEVVDYVLAPNSFGMEHKLATEYRTKYPKE